MGILGSIGNIAKGVINDIKDFNKDSHAKFKENIDNGNFISAFGEAVKAGAYNSVGFVAGIFAAETVAVTSGLEAAGKALFGTASSSAIENAAQSACIGSSTALSSGELKDFVEKFEESQKTDSESKTKRKAPSFKRNPNYKGKIADMIKDKGENTKIVGDEGIEKIKNKDNEKVKNEGYLSNSREESVSSKPTDEQQNVIDNYVESALEKCPGDVLDKVSYKDEDGNLLKEVVTKEDENGKKYSVTIEYDEQGRVSSVNRQCDEPGTVDGMKTSFTYNEDGSIDVKQDSGAEQNGVRASNLVYIEPQKINPDGSMSGNGVGSHIIGDQQVKNPKLSSAVARVFG